jgi:putative membrane protein
MKRAAIVLSCLMLATPVVAQSLGERTGINSSLGISPKTEDFVTQAAISDMFEIASSKIAQSQGNDVEKKFAEQMIQDHTKTSSELKRLVGPGGSIKVDIPSQLDSAHQSKLETLNKSLGGDFSATYASQQVAAHKDAVSLFERYANGGDQTDLKEWAGKTLPALKHHLEMAQQLEQQRAAPTVGSTAK